MAWEPTFCSLPRRNENAPYWAGPLLPTFYNQSSLFMLLTDKIQGVFVLWSSLCHLPFWIHLDPGLHFHLLQNSILNFTFGEVWFSSSPTLKSPSRFSCAHSLGPVLPLQVRMMNTFFKIKFTGVPSQSISDSGIEWNRIVSKCHGEVNTLHE